MHKLFILLVIWLIPLLGAEPHAFYAVYQHQPEEAITLCLINPSKERYLNFYYQKVGESDWRKAQSKGIPLEFRSKYLLHRVEISGLEADTLYRVVEPVSGEDYFFKTLPRKLHRPLKFVVGGDIYHDSIHFVNEVNRLAASYDPDFALLGGDIAYASPPFSFMKDDSSRWLRFLRTWSKTMISKEKRLIPLLAVLGNHDVRGRYGQTELEAELFYRFFPTPGSSYWKFSVGDFFRLWLLDSGHAHPVEGTQTEWLAHSLKDDQDVPYRFAIYHVPAFPSVRSFNNSRSGKVRNHWVPLFAEAGLIAAFEHHDHAYKRTKEIGGVVYFGDGAWGIEKPRNPQFEAPFLAKTASETHFMVVTLDPLGVKIKAINKKGEIFDEWEKRLRREESRDFRRGDIRPDSRVEAAERVGIGA